VVPIPTLTIVIPYFKNLAYLEEALHSVLGQSSNDWACIVIDDCSEEPARQIVESLKSTKVTYVRNDSNLGLSGNWNKAIDLASTDLVSIFHADDVMGPNYTQDILDGFKIFPNASAIHCRSRLINEKGALCNSFSQKIKDIAKPKPLNGYTILEGDHGLRSITFADWIICPTMTFKSNVIKALRFDSELRFATDLKLFAQLLLDGHSIIGLESCQYSYRVHSKSQTASMQKNGKRFLEEWQVISWIGDAADKKEWRKTSRVAKFKLVLRGHILLQAFKSLKKIKPFEALQMVAWAFFKPPKKS
jgi:glycosyltransferase involved in cell wall biosynthesis